MKFKIGDIIYNEEYGLKYILKFEKKCYLARQIDYESYDLAWNQYHIEKVYTLYTDLFRKEE